MNPVASELAEFAEVPTPDTEPLIADDPSSTTTSQAELPPRTPQDKKRKPHFVAGDTEGPPKLKNELRRHHYRRGGPTSLAVKCKIKLSRRNEGQKPEWLNWYKVRDANGVVGWQTAKPEGYADLAYIGSIDPFGAETKNDFLFWPEGEKDCDTITNLGLLAFCFGGTGDGLPGAENCARGRHVVILADNDPQGHDHAKSKAALAAPVAASVRVVHFPELVEKQDVSDWLSDKTADDLIRRANSTPLWQPRGDAQPDKAQAQSKTYISAPSFEMTEGGLFYRESNRKDEDAAASRPTWISAPFEILGRVRDPKGEDWARLLRWSDDDKRVHDHPVSDAELHSDISALCANLASRGLRISTGRNRQYLVRYLNDVVVQNRVTVVTTTGWHDIGQAKVFALPDDTISSGMCDTVIVQGATTAPFECRGTLVDWQNGVGSLVAGHSRAAFAASTAFAGPLLGLLGLEGGGFHLYGQSSRGKTTIVKAAASVWGRGDSPGFVRPWRSTANALEAVAAMHTDTLLPLDELGVMDAKDAAPATYQLTGGTGKGRSKRDGSLRKSLTWRTMLLSTGELRLVDKLMEGHQRTRAGQQVRLVDVPADAGKGFGAFDNGGFDNDAKKVADSIQTAAQTSYGTAGPEFVRRLIADGLHKCPDDIRAMIDAFREKYAPKNADGQVLRVADRFGLVAAAGELACDFAIVRWHQGEALEAARRCFADWFDSRGGAEAGEVQTAISQVRLFIERHGDSRFEPVGTQDRPVINRAGWRKGDSSEREWLIPPETWKSEVALGHDPTFVARVLADREMLKRAPDGYQCVERVQGRSQRVYVVTASILSEPDHE